MGNRATLLERIKRQGNIQSCGNTTRTWFKKCDIVSAWQLFVPRFIGERHKHSKKRVISSVYIAKVKVKHFKRSNLTQKRNTVERWSHQSNHLLIPYTHCCTLKLAFIILVSQKASRKMILTTVCYYFYIFMITETFELFLVKSFV